MRKLLRIVMVVGLALAAAWPAAASAQVSADDGGVLAEQHGENAQMEDEEAADEDEAEEEASPSPEAEDEEEAEEERPTEPADTGDGSLAGAGSGLGWILFAGLGATALIGRYVIRRH